MFKWVFGLALTASIAFCVYMDFTTRDKLENLQNEISLRKSEVARIQGFVNEVEAYQRKKDALQKRIDMINQLKQQQRGAASALANLRLVDPKGVQSIAVVGQDLVVNRR